MLWAQLIKPDWWGFHCQLFNIDFLSNNLNYLESFSNARILLDEIILYLFGGFIGRVFLTVGLDTFWEKNISLFYPFSGYS